MRIYTARALPPYCTLILRTDMQLFVVSVCLLGAAVAEPPVSGHYGPPGEGQEPSEHARAPGPQYGAPSSRPQARPSAQYGAPSSGYGQGDDERQSANYEFQYDVTDQEAGLMFGHQEQRVGEVARGRYYVLLPDGRTQTVEYTADQDGYHPTINYKGGEGYGRGSAGGYK